VPAREAVALVAETKPAVGAGEATLIVRCTDRVTHALLAGVTVSVFESDEVGSVRTAIRSGNTTQDGSTEISVPANTILEFNASRNDGNSGIAYRRLEGLLSGERREFAIELAIGVDLHWYGKILAREDRNPIPGARITLIGDEIDEFHGERSGETVGRTVQSGTDGLIDLWLRSWKHDELQVEASGHGRAFVQVASGHETPETAMLVLLSRSAKLRARLLLAGDVPATAGAVRLKANSHVLGIADPGERVLPLGLDCVWEGTADDAGVCSLEDLPSDVPLSVTILVDKVVVRSDLHAVSLRPGETREVEWRIESADDGGGGVLEGKVFDQAGKPVEGCTIGLAKARIGQPTYFDCIPGNLVIERCQTDAQGRYSFQEVHAGRWWIGPAVTRRMSQPPPGTLAALAEVVEIPGGNSSTHLDLHVFQGLYIQGTVLDAAGRPAPNIDVEVETDTAADVPDAETGNNGCFRVGPLVPGRYSLFAEVDGTLHSDPVTASAGEDGVVLRLKQCGALSGTVMDVRTGKPCRAEVCIALRKSTDSKGLSVDPKDLSLDMMPTEEDGTFRAEELLPGVYDIAARAGSRSVGLLKSVRVEAGAETRSVVVTVLPGAALRIRNGLEDGNEVYFVSGDGVSIACAVIQAGETGDVDVPPGHVVIRWGVELGSLQQKELDLKVGEVREVVLGGDH
jgi:protocatechuate 3,4-dioxygenase beta subunit